MSTPMVSPRCGTRASLKRSSPRLFKVDGTPSLVPLSEGKPITLSADVALRIGSGVMVAAHVEHALSAEQVPRRGLVISTVDAERVGTLSVTELSAS